MHRVVVMMMCVLVSVAMPAYSWSDEHVDPVRDCKVVASIPYWDQDRAFASFRENVDAIDFLSVFWYTLDRHGNIRKYVYANEDRGLLRFAHENGVKVLALIANLPDDEKEGRGKTWDPKRVDKVIESDQARRKHVDDIVQLVTKGNFDGVIIDYEALPGRMRKKYSLFMARLSKGLHAHGKILAVALHPKTSEFNPREDNGSHAQDWHYLREYVDQLHFMTFGEHTPHSPPGPVASPGWIRAVLEYIVKDVKLPSGQVFYGMPLYGEAWAKKRRGYVGRDVDLTYSDIEQEINSRNQSGNWSDEYSSPFARFRDKDDVSTVIWYEDERSIEIKLQQVREYGLCNLMLWRLGGEDPGVWKIFRRAGY